MWCSQPGRYFGATTRKRARGHTCPCSSLWTAGELDCYFRAIRIKERGGTESKPARFPRSIDSRLDTTLRSHPPPSPVRHHRRTGALGDEAVGGTLGCWTRLTLFRYPMRLKRDGCVPPLGSWRGVLGEGGEGMGNAPQWMMMLLESSTCSLLLVGRQPCRTASVVSRTDNARGMFMRRERESGRKISRRAS